MNINFLRLLNKTAMKCMKVPGPLPRVLNRNMTASVSTQKLQKEKYSFQEMLPNILESLEQNPKLSEVPEVASWIRKVLEYNMDGGKKIRGLVTVHAFESMAKPEFITDESLRLARVMGWCVEMLQSYLLVLDDIMDGSKTRRGVPCWYRIPEVGLGAINDTIFIHMSLFQTLNTYFADNPNYSQIVDLFNEVLLFTSIGQHLDYTTAHRKNDYSLFTIDRYMAIIKYKTAYYTYKLPVSLGLLLANITDKKIHAKYEEICLELGKLFQMQDDYLDCYGVETLTGKSGTDIQEGKCTWFAVQALGKCNHNQRIVFTTCYGSNEPAHIERIQRLYDQLGLQQLYSEHESAVYNKIVKQCEDLQSSTGLSSSLIMNMLDMIYKRKQ